MTFLKKDYYVYRCQDLDLDLFIHKTQWFQKDD